MLFFYCYMMITDFFLVVFFQNQVLYCWVLSRFYYWRLQGNSVPLWGCARSLLYWQFLPAPAPSFGVTHENFNSFWWGLHYENIREERKVLGLQAKVWRGEAVVKSDDWCWQTVMFPWKGKLKCHVHFCVFFVIKLWSRVSKMLLFFYCKTGMSTYNVISTVPFTFRSKMQRLIHWLSSPRCCYTA